MDNLCRSPDCRFFNWEIHRAAGTTCAMPWWLLPSSGSPRVCKEEADLQGHRMLMSCRPPPGGKRSGAEGLRTFANFLPE